jgi:cytochrome b561
MTDMTNDAPGRLARPPFDPLTMLLQWTALLLVIGQFATAWSIDRLAPPMAVALLTVHRSAGVVLWTLMALRLVWRITGMRIPPPPSGMTRWHIAGVHMSEYGLYALLLVQPLTGMADTLFRGRAFNMFIWRVPAMLTRNRPYAGLAHTLHIYGAYLLAAAIAVHAIAALAHHFVLKDQVLVGMLPTGRRRSARSGRQTEIDPQPNS